MIMSRGFWCQHDDPSKIVESGMIYPDSNEVECVCTNCGMMIVCQRGEDETLQYKGDVLRKPPSDLGPAWNSLETSKSTWENKFLHNC